MGRYWYAVFAVSLLLHLIVFWPAPRVSVSRATPIIVRFVPGAGSQSSVQGAAEISPAQRDLPQQERGADNAAAVSGNKAVRPRQAAMAVGASTGAHTEIGVRAAPSLPVEGVFLTSPSELGDPDEDKASWIGRYRLALAVAAVRVQRGSGLVAAQGQQGRVVVAVHFGPGAGQPDVGLAESSGRSVLDNRALDLVRGAAAHLSAPPRKGPISVELPILFEAPE